MDDKQGGKKPPQLAGGLALWAWKLALRLAMLKEPGVYQFLLILRPDGTRELVLQNAERPHKIEHLGN